MTIESSHRDPALTSPEPAGPQVKTVACLGGISLERGVAREEISAYLSDLDNLVWMDVQDPGQEELSMLLEEFGFHPLALEDAARGRQRPKVDEYKSYLFVVTYGAVPGDDFDNVRLVEVDLFIGRNFLVTVHRGPMPALQEAHQRWTRGGAMLREGVGFLVYTVMDAIIDAYFPITNDIEERLGAAEIDVFTSFQQEDLQELLKLKRALIALRRVLYPQRETFHIFLRRDHPFFSANTRLYFQDVYDHVLRIADMVDIQRDMAAGATEAYLTVLSNRMNQTMKTLTVITVCVAVAGIVFGAWGMNFTRIPLSNSPSGFWIVFVGTLALVGGMLWLSWKRRWL